MGPALAPIPGKPGAPGLEATGNPHDGAACCGLVGEARGAPLPPGLPGVEEFGVS